MASLIPAAGSTGSGSLTLQGPSTSSTQTVTIPDATGTMMVSGNMPAFSVYQNSATSVSNGTFTKIALQVKEFDTASCFDNTTNYRFTPNVAGYYQINGCVNISTASQGLLASIYKNGSEYKRGVWFGNASSIGNQSIVSSVVYLNGTTDYVELYIYQSQGGTYNTNTGSNITYFNGCMMRGA